MKAYNRGTLIRNMMVIEVDNPIKGTKIIIRTIDAIGKTTIAMTIKEEWQVAAAELQPTNSTFASWELPQQPQQPLELLREHPLEKPSPFWPPSQP